MTYGSAASGPVIPPAREGHRRKFSETDKRQIVEEAVQPGASLSEVARRYGIAARVLFRWKQELAPTAAPMFVTVRTSLMRARLYRLARSHAWVRLVRVGS
jgi:transposase-like protein